VKQLESNLLVVIDNFLDTKGDVYKKVTSEEAWADWDKLETDTYWMDRDENPPNIFAEVGVKIWEYASNYTPVDYDGIEYWYKQTSHYAKNHLGRHKDKDEAHWLKTGEFKHPFIGSIYYCHKEVPTGGFLQIERGMSRELERIQAVPNRLILFDSSNWHSVSEVRHGTRRHLATNIWIKKPDADNFCAGALESIKNRYDN